MPISDIIYQPYRSRGIGSQALQHLIDAATAHAKPKISALYLHVQVSNEEAKKFYERHGFKEAGLYKDYYKKITPHDAWILQRDIEHPDKVTAAATAEGK